MKLIALKHISARLPKGAIFEEGGSRAKLLIAVKAAAPAPERSAPAPPKPPPAPEPPSPAPEPPAPKEPQPKSEAAPPRRGRPVTPHSYQRPDGK